MQIDRQHAEAHLKRGFPVLFQGKKIEPARRLDGTYKLPTDLPPEDAGGAFVATRHDDGAFTRAGLAHVIENGGGVMLGTHVITDLESLPPEEVIAGGDVARLEAAKKAQDDAFNRFLAEREATAKELEKARANAEAVKNAPPPPANPNPMEGAPKLGGTPNVPRESVARPGPKKVN